MKNHIARRKLWAKKRQKNEKPEKTYLAGGCVLKIPDVIDFNTDVIDVIFVDDSDVIMIENFK